MDGWFFDAIRERGPNQPLLVIDAYTAQAGETPTSSATVEAVLDAVDSADTEASLRRFGGYLLSVKGAAHEDFTDQPLISPLRSLSHRGTLPAREIHSIVRGYVVAFFDKTLRGKDSGVLDAHSNPYSEAWLEAWPASRGASIGSDGQ
jgi:hypothetical protein